MTESTGAIPPGRAAWRRVTTLKPEELQELLALIDHVEQNAGRLSGEGTLTAGPVSEGTITQHLPGRLSGEGTLTVSTSWNIEAREVHTTEGTATAYGTGYGTITLHGSGTGYAPAIKSEAVKSVWESIQPASATDAVAYLQELRKWVLIVLFVVIGGASSEDVWNALENAFSFVVESVEDDAEEDAFRSSVGSVQKDATEGPDPAKE
jgi:hypothetical protein